MKRLLAAFTIIAALLVCACYFGGVIKPVEAQTTAPAFGLTSASTLAGCQAIGQNTVCVFGSSTAPGLAVSIGGSAFIAMQPAGAQTAGVTSFNTRTGAVVSANGDYNFTQLTGAATAAQLPTNFKCNLTFTLSAPTSGTSTNQLSGTAQLGGCQ